MATEVNWSGGDTYLAVGLKTNIAGELNEDDAVNGRLRVLQACNATRLDIDQTETLVTNAPCYVLGAIGNDGNTGYSDFINAAATGGGSTPVMRVNLGDGVNILDSKGILFSNGLCVNGESVGHDITVFWMPA